MNDENAMRHIRINGHEVRTWDSGRHDRNGKWLIGYSVLDQQGEEVFRGEDIACSPEDAVDSDEALCSLLRLLCHVEPGIYERGTFKQRWFWDHAAEGISQEVADYRRSGFESYVPWENLDDWDQYQE